MFGFQRLERNGLEFFGYGATADMEKWLEGKGYQDDGPHCLVDYVGNPLELADDEDLREICNWLSLYWASAEDIGQYIEEETCHPEDLDKMEFLREKTESVEAERASLILNKLAFGMYDQDDPEEIRWAIDNRYLLAVHHWLYDNGYEDAIGPERAAELIEGYIDAVGDLAA